MLNLQTIQTYNGKSTSLLAYIDVQNLLHSCRGVVCVPLAPSYIPHPYLHAERSTLSQAYVEVPFIHPKLTVNLVESPKNLQLTWHNHQISRRVFLRYYCHISPVFSCVLLTVKSDFYHYTLTFTLLLRLSLQ
jgi:hypothetical protein